MKISAMSNGRPAAMAVAIALGIGLACPPAAANGRFPEANQIVFSPTDPQLVVLRTTYGILVSHDNGGTWKLLCENALGVSTNSFADPSIGLTGNNSLLAGVALGLDVSQDVGCNWNCVGGPLANQTIVDLAVRSDAPDSAVAITGSYEIARDSGQMLNLSQVFETTDDGVTWTALGTAIDPQVAVTTIEVSKTDPARLYVSGTRSYAAQRTASLFVSNDRGQTWAEWPLPETQFDPATEAAIYIAAVDPTNADRVYIRSSGLFPVGRSRLTVANLSPDGPPTFVTAETFEIDAGMPGGLPPPELLGFALSADGSRVYVGTREHGLWTAQTSDMVFHQTSTDQIECLGMRGSELWACSMAAYGFIVGVSTDDGTTFTPRLAQILDVAGPIDCAPSSAGAACGQSSNASQCAAALENLCSLYEPAGSGCSGLDASSPASDASGDGSAGGTSTPISRHKSSSSCALALSGGEASTAIVTGAGLAFVGLAFRRRRRVR